MSLTKGPAELKGVPWLAERLLALLYGTVFLLFVIYYVGLGTADGGTVVKVLCSNRKIAGSIPDGVIGIFH
jgi:hypothetical protein